MKGVGASKAGPWRRALSRAVTRAVASAVAAAALALAAPGVPAQPIATASAEASALCAAVPPRAALAALHAACRALDAADAGEAQAVLMRVLDVGEAAYATDRLNDAARLIEALRPAASDSGNALDAESRGRIHVLQARLASERAEVAPAQQAFAAARAQFESAGLTHSARFAAVLIGQSTGWRHLRVDGWLQRATDALDQAAALLASLGLATSLEMTDLLNERTVLAYARQDLPATVVAARQEVAMLRQLGQGDSASALHAQATLGAVLSQLRRDDEAEAELNEAQRLIDLNPGAAPAAVLGVLNNTALLQMGRSQHAAALATAERACAFATANFGAAAARMLTPLTVRGEALQRLARYGEARRALEQALEVAIAHEASVGPLRRLRLQNGLAAVLLSLGETADARELIERGLRESSSDANLGYWRGRLLLRGAALAAREQRFDEADAGFAAAIELIAPVSGESDQHVISSRASRCHAQTRLQAPPAACAELAARSSEAIDAAPATRFNVLAALAAADERDGRSDDALVHLLQAVAAAESAATPDPLWSAYAALASHLRGRGLNATAIIMGKRAVEQIERMRAFLGADAQRFERGFLFDKFAVYRRLADWLTEDGRVDEALSVIRLLKQEEFLDFVNRDGGLLGRSDGAVSRTLRELAVWERWQGAAAAAGTGVAESTGSARREADQVARWLAILERDAGAPVPVRPSQRAAQGGRRVAPPPGDLWVWIYSGERRINLVIDAPRRRDVVVLDSAPTALGGAVVDLLGALERREPVLERLRALHAQLGAPIERAAATAGARRIVLMVDGPLRYLPFAALHDGRDYLGSRYGVEQRVLLPAPADARRGGNSVAGRYRLLAMGVTRGLGGMAALREVSGEICGIVAGPVAGLAADDTACGPSGAGRGVMPGSGWVDGEFTATRLEGEVAVARRRAASAGILHLGTHFVLRPGRMGRSWLLLGDGDRMTLDSLARLDFGGQSLVTLSACETGLGGAGDAGSGEEIDGLGGLLLRRGAGAVVASLWRIEDASTSRLMQAFYRQLAAGVAPAAALQRAQAAMRAAGNGQAHPFYWAGFHLVTGGH